MYVPILLDNEDDSEGSNMDISELGSNLTADINPLSFPTQMEITHIIHSFNSSLNQGHFNINNLANIDDASDENIQDNYIEEARLGRSVV